jgi:hypothetical protein
VDGHRFDDLIKHLATPTSRRSVLRGLFTAAAASIGLGAQARAAEVKRQPGQICRKPGDCAAGLACTQISTGRSVCTCTGGLTACGGVCVDTTSDENHCGACATMCDPGLTPSLAQVCTVDGCCKPFLACGIHCCFNGDACDESESACCFHEQICGVTGAETCCPGTQYCVQGQCQTSGRGCATTGNCLAGEVCAAGGVCCTPDRMCGDNCCEFGKSGCAGDIGDVCANLTPQGGVSRF